MDGDAVRWLGVALFALGGAIRLWPVFVLGDRFSGLVAIQPGRPRISPRTRDPKSALPLRPSADRGDGSQTRRWREVDSNFAFRALNERRTAPISRGTGRPNALPSRRLSIDKITSLDARFRYLRAVSMRGVMQRGLRCDRHYTD